MNKSFLGIGIVVLVILGAVYLFGTQNMNPSSSSSINNSGNVPPLAQSTSQPSPTQTQSNIIVKFTDNGFSPSSVTIKNGETVQWINDSSSDMWVASNPHPTHIDYPGFDELQFVPKAGTYLFTFEKTGSWGYHNHLNPSNHGTVVVQ